MPFNWSWARLAALILAAACGASANSWRVAPGAQTPEHTTPRLVNVELTFFSVDKDIDVLGGQWAITHRAFQDLIARHSSGKKPRLRVWAVRGKVIEPGESFDFHLSETPAEEEGLRVSTAAGDGRVLPLWVSALHRRLEDRGNRTYDVISKWGLSTSLTLPIGAVTILGGAEGDPLMGKKPKKRLPPQALYVAISVRPAG